MTINMVDCYLSLVVFGSKVLIMAWKSITKQWL